MNKEGRGSINYTPRNEHAIARGVIAGLSVVTPPLAADLFSPVTQHVEQSQQNQGFNFDINARQSALDTVMNHSVIFDAKAPLPTPTPEISQNLQGERHDIVDQLPLNAKEIAPNVYLGEPSAEMKAALSALEERIGARSFTALFGLEKSSAYFPMRNGFAERNIRERAILHLDEQKQLVRQLLSRDLGQGTTQLNPDNSDSFVWPQEAQARRYDEPIIGEPGSKEYTPSFGDMQLKGLLTLNGEENPQPNRVGQLINQRLDKDANISEADVPAYSKKAATGRAYEHGHTIMDAFYQARDAQRVTYDLGLPISDAYQVISIIGGKPVVGYVQLFERGAYTMGIDQDDPTRVNLVEGAHMGSLYMRILTGNDTVNNPQPTPEPTPTTEPVPETPEQKMEKNLKDLADELGLNINEITKYSQTKQTEGYNSFNIIKNAQNEPAVIMVTGGKYGFNHENVKTVADTFQEINRIDPNMVKLLQQYGLRATSFEMEPGNVFQQYPDFGGTYFSNLGIVLANQNAYSSFPRGIYMGLVLMESRAIGFERLPNLPDKLDPRAGIDKAKWLTNWAEINKEKLVFEDYDYLIKLANATMGAYTN
jgi:hypothetical protein